MTIHEASTRAIRDAANIIRSGGLVAFPTETVYGLGANALDGKAAAKIFEAKGRPAFNPLIVHVPDFETAESLAEFNDMAREVATAFWPGALTLILPKREGCPVSDLCTAGLETIALRVPSHPVTQDLMRQAEVPIAAPSANASGEPSPTVPIHVVQSLGDKVDMILAAGRCTVGLESTVLDLSGENPVILRPGGVTAEMLTEIIGHEVRQGSDDRTAPKSPGQLLKHYAPGIPVRLHAVDVGEGEALLAFGSIKFMGIRGGGAAKDLPQARVRNLSERGDLHEAAANLFAYLRELDNPAYKAIAVMDIPKNGIGAAINERLRRAAQM